MDERWQIAALLLSALIVAAGVSLLVWRLDRPRRLRKAYDRQWDFTGMSIVRAWSELYEAAETRGYDYWFKAMEGSPVRLTLVGGSKLIMEIVSNIASWPPEPGATVRMRVIARAAEGLTREWCIDVVADANGDVPFGYDATTRFVFGKLCYSDWMSDEKVARWAKKIHAETKPRPY